tara:strand:- start:174 stop:533 length:360 start_codon:yes stop_codon:yes gene_type:complete
MRLFIYINSLTVLFFVAIWAYSINYESRAVLKRNNALSSEIKKEEDYLSILTAEWAYLNRPERLESLAEKFFSSLKLMPVSQNNFVNINLIGYHSLVEAPFNISEVPIQKSNFNTGLSE